MIKKWRSSQNVHIQKVVINSCYIMSVYIEYFKNKTYNKTKLNYKIQTIPKYE